MSVPSDLSQCLSPVTCPVTCLLFTLGQALEAGICLENRQSLCRRVVRFLNDNIAKAEQTSGKLVGSGTAV
jgi:hypothetical protein